jgi:hypothetical protein
MHSLVIQIPLNILQFETAKIHNQNNRYTFSEFYGKCCLIGGRLFRILPRVEYVISSSVTWEQADYVTRHKISKGCHLQNTY